MCQQYVIQLNLIAHLLHKFKQLNAVFSTWSLSGETLCDGMEW